ncbi:ribonuclease E activity regulator RraA [Pseudomonas asiatica]|uniref:4-hydroxy-4-methyl-2-oxoglutarate aldolase n=1 Tax=Pseudomonas putida TaxID=303 RepID=A0A1L5PP80_PSEPU|nr:MULTISPECIES: ribonuclease E activity regulator RraA [Pseudomonas]APO81969.1 ribonuclease activity regulator protein RraA [Pseudomonas putida]WJD72428.1 ribonuclease E activity regulator RraA [Pseudomonas asiatica]
MIKTTDLCDELGERARVLAPVFVDLGGKRDFQGQAVTVKCFEDNSRVKELSSQPGQGKVLVIDGGGSERCALFGDHIAEDLARNGWAGVLVYGHVRDKAVLQGLPLAIKALGVTPRKSVKRNEGQVGLSVTFAGQTIAASDWLYGDDDGVVVLDAPCA